MTVFSAETGFCEAVLLDNGYLTDLRTALAGAVAARYLALEKLTTVGVIGCGVQARLQMRALALVRDFQRLLVWGRNPERAKEYQEEMLSELGCEVALADSPEALVRQSQCVVTTTPTREPLIQASWIHPGLHITAMGSDLPGKQELEANILRLADRLVCDLRPQAQRLGELQHLEPQESLGAIELGELVSGEKLGRLDDDAITVCDLSGIGVQDTAIALLTLRRAEEQGHGLPAKAEV